MSKTKKTSVLYSSLPVLAIVLLLTAWTIFANGNDLFPSLGDVASRFNMLRDKPISNAHYLAHIGASLKRVLFALAIAWVLGLFLGVLIGWNKYFKAILGSILEVFRPIPPIAWIPIVIMWSGIGELSKVILVFIGAFYPVLINTAAGISMVDRVYIDVGKVFGGSERQILKDVVFPTAIPQIFAGIRNSVSSAWTTVLAAEMMGASLGLGAIIMKGWQVGDMSLVLVSVITIAIIGALLAITLNKIERLIMPWNK